MAYFKNSKQEKEHKPLFKVPFRADDTDESEEYLQDWQENSDIEVLDMEAEKQKNRFLLISGIGDFFGVLAGTVLILICIAILISLGNWLIEDIDQFMTLWKKM